MSNEVRSELLGLLEAWRQQSILGIGPDAPELLAEYLRTHATCALTTIAHESMDNRVRALEGVCPSIKRRCRADK
jgi:hypothetical protein